MKPPNRVAPASRRCRPPPCVSVFNRPRHRRSQPPTTRPTRIAGRKQPPSGIFVTTAWWNCAIIQRQATLRPPLPLTSPSAIQLQDCWAKTDPETGRPCLSVADHCLLVGHVARILAESLPSTVREPLPAGSVTLAAAHDIGKLTPGFQLKCFVWDHYEALRSTLHHDGLVTDHARVSARHLAHAEPASMPREAWQWLVSTAGHHGSYSSGYRIPGRECNEGVDVDAGIHPHFEQLRGELLACLTNAFGPLPAESARGNESRVHLLTGFTIFADWIGSNPDWFPPGSDNGPEVIARKTREVLQQFGLPVQVRANRSFGELFAPRTPEAFPPRPLQQAMIEAADRPGLYIVEAPMGTGKTEAALAAAYRRWTEGDERGLYFALPTQLTSNKIHERITDFLGEVLTTPSWQSLIHGNAWLSDERNRLIAPRDNDGEHLDTDEPMRWFSSTRRQLLAPFGTGTIDQALLAILPARFAALRYFALAGKVIVIDEVHAYDPYMSALIDRLIEYLLPAGATVIILSATLTAARRGELVAAAGAVEPGPCTAYPLVTKVATGEDTAIHVPVNDPIPPKTVELQHHTLTAASADDYWQALADAVLSGANVVVIRNTVALAQETFRLLRGKLTDAIPPGHAGLLHSRFTHAARLTNEAHWIKTLGKDPASRPRGSLLVATQIVEQSVDIDADLLVTDLAPVELILQRIGRLHRHRHQRPPGFEVPRCHILQPPADWHADAKTIESALAPHHYIYPPLALWQAGQTLGTRTAINLPDDIRPLLESAAAARPDPVVLTAFETFLPEAQRKISDQQGTAKVRHVFAQTANDREGRETRYGIKPTANLVLLSRPPQLRGHDLILHPVHGDPVSSHTCIFSYPLARALNENAIRIPAYLVADAFRSSPAWLREYLADAVLAVVQPDTRELELYPDNETNYSFEHTAELGLSWKKSDRSSSAVTDPEDFWF